MSPIALKAILNFTWVAGTLLLVITAVLMVLRKQHREFRWFFVYLLVVAGRAPILYLLRRDYTVYFYSYWVAEAITVAVSFLVIFEIYRHVAGSTSLNVSRSTFFSISVGFLALAALSLFLMDPPEGPALLRAILVLSHAVRTMQIGLLALLLVASLFFNFYWQSLPFGFALGYGLYAIIDLVATGLRTTHGYSLDLIFQVMKVVGYQLAVVLWIAYLARHSEQHSLKKLPDQTLNEWLPVVERPIQ